MMNLQLFAEYIIRVLPGLVAGVSFVLLLPRDRTGLRIASYILIFVLVRDAMTPLGLWRIGGEGFLWIRLIDDPLMLVVLGAMSASLVLCIYIFDKDTRQYIVPFRRSPVKGVPVGIAGALVVAAPFLLFYSSVPIAARGGVVSSGLLIPILVFALLGNFLEEALFRGYFQGYMEKHTGAFRAAALSAMMFCLGHIFLASTVTDIGLPLLLFTLWEGMIAALVQMRYGLIPATAAHGGAIFLIASGIV
jgi:membrane protease YdiL (CAAX protease family)